jgi:hypothetical protein
MTVRPKDRYSQNGYRTSGHGECYEVSQAEQDRMAQDGPYDPRCHSAGALLVDRGEVNWSA